MLPFCLPHLLGGQVREVKMRPRSMWRQRADSSSARDKEKESKRWALGKIEERIRPKHLYLVPARRAEETSREECRLHNQSTQHKECELNPRTREASTTFGGHLHERAKPRRTIS
ncbi:hypothetical protein C1H46_042893 [Malus baccata]|uniref:Uncharacterized protein n=1 Tax=Malus baccata TaxID=106549 RepID=A0A540KBS2_MALBA|nr:hypothetical protein C1H46_042893 [Malus baccata]